MAEKKEKPKKKKEKREILHRKNNPKIKRRRKATEEDIEGNEKILTEKEIKALEEKQLKWTLIIVAIIILSIPIVYLSIQASRTFTFAGVDWQIQQDGNRKTGVTWYATQFGKYYKGDYYGTHTVYLRNDPRKNDIPVDVGNFSFKKEWVYSLSPEVMEYDQQLLGTMELGKIVRALPFVTSIQVSTNSLKFAKENELNYTVCGTRPSDKTLIEVKIGEQNRIYLKEKDCYVLEMKNVEDYLLVAERFEIEIIKQLNE